MEIIKLDSSTKPCDAKRPHLVTAVKPATRVEDRVNIYINDKFDFSLEIPQVVDLHLKVGRRLTTRELNDCRHASEFGKLYHHALGYALTRPHSEKEVRDHLKNRRVKREILNRQIVKNRSKPKEEQIKFKLRTKELPLYSDQDINDVMSRLMEKGYVDDKKFASYYVENHHYKKGISKKRLSMDLKKKGVSQDIIENTLNNSERSDVEEMQKIINKKSKKYTPEKLITYLVRQGFDYQQAKAAVCEMDSQNSEQNPLW